MTKYFLLGKKISEVVFEHKTPRNLILNFDQIRHVPIANSDDKRQIAGTFTVNFPGKFIPCLKLVRIMLETGILVCKYKDICGFRK